MTRLIISALVLGATLVSAPAFAQEQTSVHVSYADLNLASPQGAHVFHQRLEGTVTDICGPIAYGDLERVSAVRACRAETGRSAAREESLAVAAAAQKTLLASR